MDKNQKWGLGLMAVIVVGYFIFFRPDAPEKQPGDQTTSDSTSTEVVVEKQGESEAAATEEVAVSDSVEVVQVDENGDTVVVKMAKPKPKVVAEKTYTVETDQLRAIFSSKTGNIKELTLKEYTTFHDDTVILFDEQSAYYKMYSGEDVILGEGEYATNLKAFNPVAKGDTLTCQFTTTVNGKKVTHEYTFPGSGYEVFHDIAVSGASKKDNALDIDWKYDLKKTEEGLKYSRRYSWVYVYTSDESLDDYLDGGSDVENLEESIQWISMKQRFFNAGIISKGAPMTNVALSSVVNDADTNLVKQFKTKMSVPTTNASGTQTASLHYYYGPNDYYLMGEMGVDSYERNAYMGWKLFSFVNRFFVLPLFTFLEDFIPNYGIIILLLVIAVKTLLFPIAYRSYKSMAKMRVLKPEIDKIKAKHEGDMQKSQPETMKLYQQAGVNPLSGCIPIVLQMPILLALFNFFPSCINLRHESFLWAQDLSTYDDLISWSGSIPLLGNHISLFTLLMTISTIGYTYLNNQSNAQAQGPMKYMSYLMPVIFFFALNDFSSGLTFYYFVSNLITISQQLIATRFIDKDKIAKTIEENRKNAESGNGGKKSKFQQRLQEQLKASQEARAKK